MKIVIGVTGASGAIYAKVLFDSIIKLGSQVDECGVLFSENARQVWNYELGNSDFLRFKEATQNKKGDKYYAYNGF